MELNLKKEFIDLVVDQFYRLATTDILIGHHFRKIALSESTPGHPLKPPLEAFAHHLPRIKIFWYFQLLSVAEKKKLNKESMPPFDLIHIHRKMHLRLGELNRWLVLFHSVLEETYLTSENQEVLSPLVETWKSKVKLLGHQIKGVITNQ